MRANTLPPSPHERAAAINAVLRIWAKALGCSTSQVTEVITRSGLPMEKLWNSVAIASSRERAPTS